MRTYSPNPPTSSASGTRSTRDGAVLGRLATEVARVLRGKHKPIFAPHLDTGDHVIVVNAAKIQMTAGKADKKLHYRHSGYPGGLSARSYAELLAKHPEETFRRAVKGMLPKGPLGRHMLRKLKVYAGPTHPHAAQRPSASAGRPPHPSGLLIGPTPRQKEQPIRAQAADPSPPVAVRRPSPGSACAPARASITVNRRPIDDYFPSATHRMIITEPLRLVEQSRGLRHRHHHGWRRRLRPGRGPAPRHRPGPGRAGPRACASRSSGPASSTRDAREKESKKYGLKKARKAPQYSKR